MMTQFLKNICAIRPWIHYEMKIVTGCLRGEFTARWRIFLSCNFCIHSAGDQRSHLEVYWMFSGTCGQFNQFAYLLLQNISADQMELLKPVNKISYKYSTLPFILAIEVVPYGIQEFGSGNGLLPLWHQAIILTNADISSIEYLGKHQPNLKKKHKYFSSRKCTSKCQQENDIHLVQASKC